eukprot:1149032-Pelagomonas_calceolata.AAC.5
MVRAAWASHCLHLGIIAVERIAERGVAGRRGMLLHDLLFPSMKSNGQRRAIRAITGVCKERQGTPNAKAEFFWWKTRADFGLDPPDPHPPNPPSRARLPQLDPKSTNCPPDFTFQLNLTLSQSWKPGLAHQPCLSSIAPKECQLRSPIKRLEFHL